VSAWLVALMLFAGQPQEIIRDIRVHGNVATSDEEIRKIAGVEIGAPLLADTVTTAAERLRATKRFVRVDVLKRFASIDDPTQIVLVIIVDEGAVKIERTGDSDSPVRVVKTRGHRLMFLPIITAEDGYGLIYGARIGVPNPAGKNSRLSFPLTWGGDKRAGAEIEKDFDGALTRLSAGTSINRREHPYYDEDEDRGRIWARAERELVRSVRVGATGGWQHVSFLGSDDSFGHAGADVVVDTRRDPMLARNAVFARAAWTHYDFASGPSNNRSELEARGYVGLIGQSVLVLRALRDDATDPLPPYLQPILGGLANLRGFRAGTAVGDTLTASSVELRLPLTSPLEIAKLGVSGFFDAATVYDKGGRLADQTFKKGFGGSVWVSAAFIRFNLAVAHGIGSSTRVHFGGSLAF
jgi:outer membrane protein assembly factor BamA